jgi:hypothetical protein
LGEQDEGELMKLIFMLDNVAAFFLISNFCRFLNAVCFLLGNSLPSEFRCRGITEMAAFSLLIM